MSIIIFNSLLFLNLRILHTAVRREADRQYARELRERMKKLGYRFDTEGNLID